jgi:hypothetical protein
MGTRNRVGIGLLYRPARLHWLAELESIPRLPNTKNEDEDDFFGIEVNYSFLYYQRNEDKPKYLFLNHRRNEGKLMPSSLIYQRDEE